MNATNTAQNWKPLASEIWPEFTKSNPDLHLSPTYWACTNFLRLHRSKLVSAGVITKAQIRTKAWFAHEQSFADAARACALSLPLTTHA